jgi:hypothetical protein
MLDLNGCEEVPNQLLTDFPPLLQGSPSLNTFHRSIEREKKHLLHHLMFFLS